MASTRTIWVVAHPSVGQRCALWERHPDHPNGEVFVAGQGKPPVEVAETPEVLQALRDERLVKVDKPKAQADAQPKNDKPKADQQPAGQEAGAAQPKE